MTDSQPQSERTLTPPSESEPATAAQSRKILHQQCFSQTTSCSEQSFVVKKHWLLVFIALNDKPQFTVSWRWSVFAAELAVDSVVLPNLSNLSHAWCQILKFKQKIPEFVIKTEHMYSHCECLSWHKSESYLFKCSWCTGFSLFQTWAAEEGGALRSNRRLSWTFLNSRRRYAVSGNINQTCTLWLAVVLLYFEHIYLLCCSRRCSVKWSLWKMKTMCFLDIVSEWPRSHSRNMRKNTQVFSRFMFLF